MKVNVPQLIIRTIATSVIFALALFLPAGTFSWWAGWAYLVLVFGFAIALTFWLLKFNPDLLAERLTGIGKPDQKFWDKVLLSLLGLVFFAWLVFMPLDAVRFRWSHLPLWIQWVGALLLLASFYIFYLAFRENSYLSPAVRVQKERGQTVISTGPIRASPFVRGVRCLCAGNRAVTGFGIWAVGCSSIDRHDCMARSTGRARVAR